MAAVGLRLCLTWLIFVAPLAKGGADLEYRGLRLSAGLFRNSPLIALFFLPGHRGTSPDQLFKPACMLAIAILYASAGRGSGEGRLVLFIKPPRRNYQGLLRDQFSARCQAAREQASSGYNSADTVTVEAAHI